MKLTVVTSGGLINLNYPEVDIPEMDRVISRSNAGFCGTPPISAKNYRGTWTRVDSTLFIQVDFWGGQTIYRWKILSLSPTKLKVLVKFENYDFRTS